MQHTKVTGRSISNGSPQSLVIDLVAMRRLTDVRGTLKNFRYGADSVFTEIVSNEPKKDTFQDPLVYDSGYGEYGAEAGYIDDQGMYYIYFDVKPGFGYYLPENASVKVIRPRAAATEQSTMRLHTARSIRGRLVRLHTDRRPEIPD